MLDSIPGPVRNVNKTIGYIICLWLSFQSIIRLLAGISETVPSAAGSYNGSTHPSGGCYLGSSPSPAALGIPLNGSTSRLAGLSRFESQSRSFADNSNEVLVPQPNNTKGLFGALNTVFSCKIKHLTGDDNGNDTQEPDDDKQICLNGVTAFGHPEAGSHQKKTKNLFR